MRHAPNPFRVLAFALDVGDVELADALWRRLSGRGPSRAAQATVERLMVALGLD